MPPALSRLSTMIRNYERFADEGVGHVTLLEPIERNNRTETWKEMNSAAHTVASSHSDANFLNELWSRFLFVFVTSAGRSFTTSRESSTASKLTMIKEFDPITEVRPFLLLQHYCLLLFISIQVSVFDLIFSNLVWLNQLGWMNSKAGLP